MMEDMDNLKPSFLSSDASLAVHAGERLGHDHINTNPITTPIVNTTTYFFKETSELIDFKEKRIVCHEYARYGSPTTMALEEKLGAESTLVMASGMCASSVMLLALVPKNGHIVTTTDCYKETRDFMETFLPKLGVIVTLIDSADTAGLEAVVNNHNVSMFFTESPTNPYLRCVDIALVSDISHKRGSLVCVDGTLGTPLNQKTLSLGADLVLHSATKYIGGHNDVLAGCISGSMKLVSKIRILHQLLGGTLNPVKMIDLPLMLSLQKSVEILLCVVRCIFTHPKHEDNASSYKATEFNWFEDGPIVRSTSQGLPSHPEHHIANRQMTGFGGLVTFEIAGDLKTTIKFIDSLKIPYLAASFGGCESLVDQLATGTWDVPQEERLKYGLKDNLVRFSFGVEDFDDIKADVLQGLETI